MNPFCSVINLTELAIKRIIKMAKQIYSFSQLCQEDQVALLKGGCIELMVLRSVMNYDTEKQTWQVILHKFRRSEMKYYNPDSCLFLPQSREQ